jgi:hypothetical protein
MFVPWNKFCVKYSQGTIPPFQSIKFKPSKILRGSNIIFSMQDGSGYYILQLKGELECFLGSMILFLFIISGFAVSDKNLSYNLLKIVYRKYMYKLGHKVL